MRTSSARRSGAHLHVRTGGRVRARRAHAGSTKRTIGASHLAGTLRQLTLRPTVPLDPPEVRSSRAHPNPSIGWGSYRIVVQLAQCGFYQAPGQRRARASLTTAALAALATMQADVASVSGKPDYVEADLLGLTEEGAIRVGADPAVFAALRIPNDPERSGPRFEGTLTEFEAEYGGTEFDKKLRISTPGLPVHEAHALSVQLHNLVRKCGACGKSCAFTTTLCNGCGAELPQETVHTDNIFMSFIYGIAKVPCATLPRARRAPSQPRVCVHGCAGRSLPI